MSPNPSLSAFDVRHRMLEGFLLRLSRLPDADQFVLRGGMLLRHWFRPQVRPADDLDLVSRATFSVEDTAARLIPLLADTSENDGVWFNVSRYRIDGIWMDTPSPGVRLFACGGVAGIEDEFTVDVTFGEPLVPDPRQENYGPLSTGEFASVWTCRPETILGRKLHALMHMGNRHWRPKDLNDVRLLLEHVPMDLDELPGAIAASFVSRGNTTADARNLFRDRCWEMKSSMARWYDFIDDCPEQQIPRSLAGVVADVAARLEPTLERLP